LALVETGLYFGKGNGIDDKGGKMHGSVPVAVKGGGITVTRIPISHVPNDGGNERRDDGRSPAQVPSDHSHGRRVEREQAQLVARGAVNPSEHSGPDSTSGQKDQCFQELGCFSAQNFSNSVQQTVNQFSLSGLLSINNLLSVCPMSPEAMNITFMLFTKQNPNISQNLTTNSTDNEINSTNFSGNRKTVFIAHGYEDYWGKRPWMNVSLHGLVLNL